jgi:hypothetical protein
MTNTRNWKALGSVSMFIKNHEHQITVRERCKNLQRRHVSRILLEMDEFVSVLLLFRGNMSIFLAYKIKYHQDSKFIKENLFCYIIACIDSILHLPLVGILFSQHTDDTDKSHRFGTCFLYQFVVL